MKAFLALVILSLSFTSCSKEEVYTPIDMFMMATKFDPKVEEVRITDPSRSLKCSMYPDGCVENSPKRFKVRLVELIVVQYHSGAQACEAAKKLDQYYVRNWLFDDVKGEPVLEDFVKRVYKAENPKSCD
jgi:hypothetical protein